MTASQAEVQRRHAEKKRQDAENERLRKEKAEILKRQAEEKAAVEKRRSEEEEKQREAKQAQVLQRQAEEKAAVEKRRSEEEKKQREAKQGQLQQQGSERVHIKDETLKIGEVPPPPPPPVNDRRTRHARSKARGKTQLHLMENCSGCENGNCSLFADAEIRSEGSDTSADEEARESEMKKTRAEPRRVAKHVRHKLG